MAPTAQLTGLESFGGNGSTGNPNITVSNAAPNTPFLGGVANAGVGTGSLGEFGGYIPTPLPQFNNYQDYLNLMPGAQQMDYFASDPLNYGGIPMSDRWGFTQDVLQSPYQAQAQQGAYNASSMMLGWTVDPSTGQIVGDTSGQSGIIGQQWLPEAANWYSQESQLQNNLAPQLEGMMPEFEQQIPQLFDQAQVMQQQAAGDYSQVPADFSKAQDIWNQAADPQSALYARTVQQLQDQTRAASEAAGMGMTPYGAGIEGSTMSNFNIDWQNNLLNRMMQGAQGVAQLQGAGTNLQQTGQGFEQTAQGYEGMANQDASTVGGLAAGAGALRTEGAQLGSQAVGLQDMAAQAMAQYAAMPQDVYSQQIAAQTDAVDQYQQYGLQAMIPGQMTMKNWQDVQNQFLAANQQGFNQNQISGFEDPFSLLQLQSQIEMEREQMNMQAQMQEQQQKSQMAMQGASAGASLLGGMGGK
jgi:hypothetical protein